MRWQIITSLVAAATGCAAQRFYGSAHDSSSAYRQRDPRSMPPVGVSHDHWTRDGPVGQKFADEKTASRCSEPLGGVIRNPRRKGQSVQETDHYLLQNSPLTAAHCLMSILTLEKPMLDSSLSRTTQMEKTNSISGSSHLPIQTRRKRL
jgi:hypothetical protein